VRRLVFAILNVNVKLFFLWWHERQILKCCHGHRTSSVLFSYMSLPTIYNLKSVTMGTQQSVPFGMVELHMLSTWNIIWPSCKVPNEDLVSSKQNFTKIHGVEAKLICVDRHDKDNRQFWNFANGPQNSFRWESTHKKMSSFHTVQCLQKKVATWGIFQQQYRLNTNFYQCEYKVQINTTVNKILTNKCIRKVTCISVWEALHMFQ
jgi:hypothetical protein